MSTSALALASTTASSASPSSAAPHTPVASTGSWHQYENLGVVGRGGAAEVYLARHRGTARLHAIKMQPCHPALHPWTRATLRAQREKQILQSLRHPFVCGLHDSFQHEDYSCLVLDFQDGGNLDQLRLHAGGSLPERAVRFYAAEIVQALEYVHTMGYVHRDVKPQNVLIASDGHIRLTDFGVAEEGTPVDPHYFLASQDAQDGKGERCWSREMLNSGYHSDVSSTQDTLSCSTPGTESTRLGEEEEGEEEEEEGESEGNQAHAGSRARVRWPSDAEWAISSKLPSSRSSSSSSLPTDGISRRRTAGASTRAHGVDDRVQLRCNSLVGTVAYMPPEMIQQVEMQTTDVDWWALGCVLYELLYGISPFDTEPTNNDGGSQSTVARFRRILRDELTFPLFPLVSDSCKNLIRGLLQKTPSRRLGHCGGARDIKAHGFFKEMQWALLQHNAPPYRARHDGCRTERRRCHIISKDQSFANGAVSRLPDSSHQNQMEPMTHSDDSVTMQSAVMNGQICPHCGHAHVDCQLRLYESHPEWEQSKPWWLRSRKLPASTGSHCSATALLHKAGLPAQDKAVPMIPGGDGSSWIDTVMVRAREFLLEG